MKSITLTQLTGGGLATGTVAIGGSDGPAASPVIKAGRLGKETVLSSGLVRQEIELQLVGTAADIETYLQAVGRLLAEAERTAGAPGRAVPGGAGWVYLQAQREAGGVTWRSLVYRGRIELDDGPEARSLRAQRARVVLERADWWEGASVTLPVTNGADAGPGSTAFVWNHNDGAAAVVTYDGTPYDTLHRNWCEIVAPAGELGDMPAPARMTIIPVEKTVPAGEDEDGTNLFVGESLFRPQDTETVTFEDVTSLAMVAKAVTPDAGSSGGSYADLTWNGASAISLFDVVIPRAAAAAFGGRPCKVLFRLGGQYSNLDTERLYLRWMLFYAFGIALDDIGLQAEQEGGYLPVQAGYLEGPVLNMPPYPTDASAVDGAPSLLLRLNVKPPAGSVGPHDLKIDYACIVPLDGWRYYRAMMRTTDWSIRDYGDSEAVYGYSYAGMHRVEGPGFFIYPGRSYRTKFHFFAWTSQFQTGLESHCYANHCYLVGITYRPRRRRL